jgi:hypothetical protein
MTCLCCLQNRSLNLLLEKERQKVAKLQQSLSQASNNKEAGAVSYSSGGMSWGTRCYAAALCVVPARQVVCTCHHDGDAPAASV